MKKIYIKIKKVEILKGYLKNSCEGFCLFLAQRFGPFLAESSHLCTKAPLKWLAILGGGGCAEEGGMK